VARRPGRRRRAVGERAVASLTHLAERAEAPALPAVVGIGRELGAGEPAAGADATIAVVAGPLGGRRGAGGRDAPALLAAEPLGARVSAPATVPIVHQGIDAARAWAAHVRDTRVEVAEAAEVSALTGRPAALADPRDAHRARRAPNAAASAVLGVGAHVEALGREEAAALADRHALGEARAPLEAGVAARRDALVAQTEGAVLAASTRRAGRRWQTDELAEDGGSLAEPVARGAAGPAVGAVLVHVDAAPLAARPLRRRVSGRDAEGTRAT